MTEFWEPGAHVVRRGIVHGAVWKDVEEFEEGIWRGAISARVARLIESAKQEVVRIIERREEPFDGNWNHWLPERNWGVPELHAEWNDVQSIL